MTEEWYNEFLSCLSDLGYTGTVNEGWAEFEFFENGYPAELAATKALPELLEELTLKTLGAE
jgi:hypothetical protein